MAGLRRHVVIVALAFLTFAAALLVRHSLVPLGTGDADEGAYAYLGDLLRHGRVSMASASHVPFFHPWLTGEAGGRLFFQYEPGWPAVLALSQVLFGSKVFAPALCAAALVIAVYALTSDVFGSRRTGRIAAALVASSPLFLLHSALYLSYLFTTLVATLALLCTLRALHRESLRWAAATGAALGVMLLSRPFDGVLTGVTVVLLAMLSRRSELRQLFRFAGAVFVGAVPFLVAAALFNQRTTGSFVTFPLTASDPRNVFGFGDRGLQVGTGALHYDVTAALDALRLNARGAVGWMFGGVVTLGLAVFAATRRDQRALRLVLVCNVALFPVAYFFWWATALSARGATNGLGPHYYVPSFVAVAVLAADGYARLSRRHVAGGAALAVAALAITVVNVPDKIAGQEYATSEFTAVDHALPHDLDDAMVFVDSADVVDFTGLEHPFLISDPDIGGAVLYPSDRHGENGWLIRATPNRRPYLLHHELRPDDDLFHPHVVLTELRAESGREATLRARVTPPVAEPLQAFVEADGAEFPLQDIPAGAGERTINVGLRGATGAGASKTTVLSLDPGLHDVRIVLLRANGERWMRLYRADVRKDGTVVVVKPGTGEHLLNIGKGPVRLHEDISAVIADVER